MKSLSIEITDPQIIQAFEDIATARNIRSQKEKFPTNWTAESVARVWLRKISLGVNKPEGHETSVEFIRSYPSMDWEDVDKLRAERAMNEARSKTQHQPG